MTRKQLSTKTTLFVFCLLLTPGCRFDPVATTEIRPRDDALVDNDASSNPPCRGLCRPCLGLDMQDCGMVAGCRWNSLASCGGTCMDCSLFVTEQACRNQRGCGWSTEFFCQGQCQPCSNLDGEPACNQVENCTWGNVGEECTGDPNSCDQYDRPMFCQAMGCDWSHEECQGTPMPCQGRSQLACLAGCRWVTVEGCSGECRACDTYQDETSCLNQADCRWVQAPAHCVGQCSSCEDFRDETSCQGQATCSWERSGTCQGTCIACESFDNEMSCRSQPGCTWNG